MTAVRLKPATIDIRRETVEGLSRRISCIHRTYTSTCGRIELAVGAPGKVGP
jgi:hypothetical protein